MVLSSGLGAGCEHTARNLAGLPGKPQHGVLNWFEVCMNERTFKMCAPTWVHSRKSAELGHFRDEGSAAPGAAPGVQWPRGF